jgi:hypothetical protein
MARGEKNQAKAITQQATGLSSQYAHNAQGVNSVLTPAYTEDIKNPQGYSPQDLAAMETASSQSLGGSVAAAKGEGDLLAARTGNVGAYQPVLDESVRNAMRTLSGNAVKIQRDNAMLKEGKRAAAKSGMQGLYGTNVSGSVAPLSPAVAGVNAQTAANNNWFTDMLKAMNSNG